MAGDWIKMRGALLEHPKVIALARVLHDRKEFREWLTPGGAGEMNGQLVSNEALRCVTTALLLKVWSVAREHGKFDGDDLVLEHSVLADIDQIAGVSGFGDAMAGIGWAVLRNGVILPNFIQFNAPLDNAARQREYRERHKNVTRPLQRNGNGASQRVTTKRVTREEKSIKENKKKKTAMPDDFCISYRVRAWAAEKGHDRLEAHFENFVSKVRAKGYSYIDWDEGFMGAVRENWAKLPSVPEPRKLKLAL